MCVRACLCFCVSDPDSYHIWHKVVVFWRLCPVSCSNSFPVMAGRTSAPRCSQPWLLQYLHVYAHNFHLLFLEQSAAGAWREAPGTTVSRAQLGFHDWEAGPDYARLGRGSWRGWFFFSSRPSQGFWWRAGSKRGPLGICTSLPSERCFTRVRSVVAAYSWSNWPGPSSLIDFRYITKSIVRVQIWSKPFLMWLIINWYVYNNYF